MSDISKCIGENCNKKESCYRFTCKSHEWQGYAEFFRYYVSNDSDAKCEYYIETRNN